MRSPANWAAALDRLSYTIGGCGDEPRAAAEEWIRAAVAARWGVWTLHDLTRRQRQVAFQKTCGVVMMLEEEGEIAFAVGQRDIVRAVFARYFQGVAVDGPPWRQDPYEERPSYAEWCAEQDDDSIPEPAGASAAGVP